MSLVWTFQLCWKWMTEKKLKFADIFKKKSSYLGQLHKQPKFSADNLNVFAPVQIQNGQKNQHWIIKIQGFLTVSFSSHEKKNHKISQKLQFKKLNVAFHNFILFYPQLITSNIMKRKLWLKTWFSKTILMCILCYSFSDIHFCWIGLWCLD